jgi:hypothetical protein
MQELPITDSEVDRAPVKRLARFMTVTDALYVTVRDPDRMLVKAAKELFRVRREHCDGRCEVCDAQIARARWWCARWRQLQAVKRAYDWSRVFTAASMMVTR